MIGTIEPCLAPRPHQARHERAHLVPDELTDLHRQHLRRIHPLVEELDDPLQLERDLVGHEDEADAAGLEVGLYLEPEGLDRVLPRHLVSQERTDALGGATGPVPRLEALANPVRGPVDDRVGRVVQHLADHKVGTASWSRKRWSTDHLRPPPSSPGMPISLETRSHRTGRVPGCTLASSSGCASSCDWSSISLS